MKRTTPAKAVKKTAKKPVSKRSIPRATISKKSSKISVPSSLPLQIHALDTENGFGMIQDERITTINDIFIRMESLGTKPTLCFVECIEDLMLHDPKVRRIVASYAVFKFIDQSRHITKYDTYGSNLQWRTRLKLVWWQFTEKLATVAASIRTGIVNFWKTKVRG